MVKQLSITLRHESFIDVRRKNEVYAVRHPKVVVGRFGRRRAFLAARRAFSTHEGRSYVDMHVSDRQKGKMIAEAPFGDTTRKLAYQHSECKSIPACIGLLIGEGKLTWTSGSWIFCERVQDQPV
jgi:hypothetical protein